MSNFVEDTKNHKLTILKDDGVYRHLHCSSGSSYYHFDIITYPGHLCYSGDMGCFVFQRTKDMFEFFRSESGRINPDYWGEKLEAGKAKEFSEECFMGIINGMVNDACFNMVDFFDDISQDQLSKNAVKFKAEVKEHFENNDISAGGWYTTMYNFKSDVLKDFDFSTDFEDTCEEHTTRFIWCCHALVWAISEYDKQKQELEK